MCLIVETVSSFNEEDACKVVDDDLVECFERMVKENELLELADATHEYMLSIWFLYLSTDHCFTIVPWQTPIRTSNKYICVGVRLLSVSQTQYILSTYIT